jgi:hypothetical protein
MTGPQTTPAVQAAQAANSIINLAGRIISATPPPLAAQHAHDLSCALPLE